MLNEDYRDILRIFLKNHVKFLLVGAYAMGVHGYPRATGDIDIFVEVSDENSEKIYISLIEFGAPLKKIAKDTFTVEGVMFQIGIAPRRIDITTKIHGITFQEAYSHREEIELEGLKVPLVSKKDLIKNKESTGREKDKLDVKCLKAKKRKY